MRSSSETRGANLIGDDSSGSGPANVGSS